MIGPHGFNGHLQSFISPLTNTFSGLFATWIHEIHPMALGNVPDNERIRHNPPKNLSFNSLSVIFKFKFKLWLS